MSFLSPFVKLIFLPVTSVGQTNPRSQKMLVMELEKQGDDGKDNSPFPKLESQNELLSPVISKFSSRKTMFMLCCYKPFCDLNGESVLALCFHLLIDSSLT